VLIEINMVMRGFRVRWANRVSILVSVRLGNDLRVLLRIMSMCAESLRQRVAADESSDRDFIELEGAINGASQISRELMTLGQTATPERSAVDVHEIVAQLESVLARVLGPRIHLSLRFGALNPTVEANAVQLEWVLFNLAANSRDAMSEGGQFVITTASIDRDVGVPACVQRFIRLTVTDTGHGLFGESQTRAFEPFYSSKKGAVGLGLTSVAMIVRSFHGWLHIESAHSGTSIHIYLPALGAPVR
jgi:two-component system, cell cycle sensor histidine kinase and response regulator CckA